MTLAEAAVEANALADAGSERELAELRAKWGDELEEARWIARESAGASSRSFMP